MKTGTVNALSVCLSAGFACALIGAQGQVAKPKGAATPDEAARTELQHLRNEAVLPAGEATWKFLGFSSASDLTQATLGPPTKVYAISVEALSRYQGGDVASVLQDTGDLVYPVLVNGQGRLLIEVSKQEEGWVAVHDGYQESASGLAKAVSPHAKPPGEPMGFVFAKINAMKQQTLLVGGKVSVGNAPGGATATDLSNLKGELQVVPLNTTKTPAQTVYTKMVGKKGPRRTFWAATEEAPGGPPPKPAVPAQEYLKGLVPAAQVLAKEKPKAPG
jgi:hypothetical protein